MELHYIGFSSIAIPLRHFMLLELQLRSASSVFFVMKFIPETFQHFASPFTSCFRFIKISWHSTVWHYVSVIGSFASLFVKNLKQYIFNWIYDDKIKIKVKEIILEIINFNLKQSSNSSLIVLFCFPDEYYKIIFFKKHYTYDTYYFCNFVYSIKI